MLIEFVIRDYLEDALEGVPVYMEHPGSGETSYVIIEKIGSTETNHIPGATFAVQSYAATLAEAAKLNRRVKTAMLDAIELDMIYAVKLNSDYNYTDLSTKQYRYQGVYVITHAQEG